MSEPHTSASEDQLPTSRMPSLPSVLPPPVAPKSPALATQPLRAVAKSADDVRRPRRWRVLVSRVTSAAAKVPARIGSVRHVRWSRRGVGLSCGVAGAVVIALAIAGGWMGVAGAQLAREEHVGLAIAVVIARAVIAVAAMGVGYGLLRIGERLSFADGRDG